MIRATAALFLAVFLAVAVAMPAEALDLKDLAACRSAAIRFCDRSGGLSMAALSRCGAALAVRSGEVGPKCVAVLERYGQLSARTSFAESR